MYLTNTPTPRKEEPTLRRVEHTYRTDEPTHRTDQPTHHTEEPTNRTDQPTNGTQKNTQIETRDIALWFIRYFQKLEKQELHSYNSKNMYKSH